jgi:hypothetical protein
MSDPEDCGYVKSDPDNVDRIVGRILEATYGKQERWVDVMTAVKEIMIFQLSVICSDCRKLNHKKIRQHLPAWLNRANQMAGEHPERVHQYDKPLQGQGVSKDGNKLKHLARCYSHEFHL